MADLTCGKCKENDTKPCACAKRRYVCPVCDGGRCPDCPVMAKDLLTGKWMLVKVRVDPLTRLEGLAMEPQHGQRVPLLPNQFLQITAKDVLVFSWLKPEAEDDDDEEEAEGEDDKPDDPAPAKGKLTKKERQSAKKLEKAKQLQAEKRAATKQLGEERGRGSAIVVCGDVWKSLAEQHQGAKKGAEGVDSKDRDDKKNDEPPSAEEGCTYPVFDATGQPSGLTLVLVKPLTVVPLAAPYSLVRDDPWRERLVCADEAAPAVEGTISASRGSQKKEGAKGSSSNRPKIERWLIHTGRMSGDLWHIIGALRFDPLLKLVIVWANQDKDEERTRALQALIKSLGLPNEHFSAQYGSSVDNQVACSVGSQYVKSKTAKAKNTLCGHTWASTSLIAQQVSASKQGTCVAFAELFDPKRIHPGVLELFMKYTVGPALAQLKDKGRYLFVNMRWVGDSGQNPQHNITGPVFRQILEVAELLNKAAPNAPPIQIVRVGQPELVKKYADSFKWLEPYLKTTLAVDLYHDAMVSKDLFEAMLDNKLLQPFFWRCLREEAFKRAIRIDFFGGRSGGMDIASFLGVRTASWDVVDETDFNYMRLHMLAPLNSVISYSMHHGIDQGALSLWLQGANIVPALPNGGPLVAVGNVEEYGSQKPKLNALLYPPP